MMKIRVAQGVQVVHESEVFADGETAEVPEAVAGHWLREGWAVEVVTAPTRSTTRAPARGHGDDEH